MVFYNPRSRLQSWAKKAPWLSNERPPNMST
jgi:hypothetical protein